MGNKKSLRKKYFFLNTVTSVFNQIILILSGFILPRAMLVSYGSEINGLVSSITQFLGFISFLQAGVGVVIQVAWYKPLHENNYQEISKIYKSAQDFFRKIALIFLVYTFILAFVYPTLVKTPFSNVYVTILVFIISINLFSQYYFGLTNLLLLNADQKAYIPLAIQTVTLLLNLIVSAILIYGRFPILVVQFISNILNLLFPITMIFYVKNNYAIDRYIKYDNHTIKDKWSGFAQHISAVIVDNTDIVVLTVFSTLSNVSIYYVYYIVVNALKLLLLSFTGGIQSLFGNMIVRKEIHQLKKLFLKFEIIFGYITTILYASTLCLINSFVTVYTDGVNDVDFAQPAFSFLLTIAYAMFCYRTIYYTLIKAAGRFRETQFGAILESILNIVISILCVNNLGLVGVAIGTLVSVSYRTIYCVQYLSSHLIYREQRLFYKNIFLNVIIFVLSYVLTINLNLQSISYLAWFMLAIQTFAIVAITATVAYAVMYKKELISLYKKMRMGA